MTLEVYDVITRFYRPTIPSASHDQEIFHLAPGDFSSYNILIDPDTGAVTGIIDWEMAGFCPAWLAAVGGRREPCRCNNLISIPATTSRARWGLLSSSFTRNRTQSFVLRLLQ
jgi:hypothetical protein